MTFAVSIAVGIGGLIVGLWLSRRPKRPLPGRQLISRLGVSQALPFAHAVVHGDVAYLSGVTAQADGQPISESDSVEDQTRRVLAVIDKRLALAGSHKSQVLQAQVWLKDIAHDFKAMNATWNEWVGSDKPVRATVESKLATPAMLVEIQVTAAR
uniref:RidA family protein n=1 Tax=Haptolina brevifila TaxID=156173 RepID=A0A7S2IRK7_9EUKA|mmetsp:Transcript_69939/g.138617  ORF Transcript_69939/g.138617 Transcript_69939/m.138617 type:complete len:155 (+) Transcript_69939:73-537(+)